MGDKEPGRCVQDTTNGAMNVQDTTNGAIKCTRSTTNSVYLGKLVIKVVDTKP